MEHSIFKSIQPIPRANGTPLMHLYLLKLCRGLEDSLNGTQYVSYGNEKNTYTSDEDPIRIDYLMHWATGMVARWL